MSTESDNTSKPAHPSGRQPPSIDDLKDVNISDGVKNVEGSSHKPNGSSVKQQYKHRTMCYYPVTEDELSNIASFNRISTVFFSFGSFLLGLTIDVSKDIYTSTDMVAETKAQMTAGAIAGVIVTIVCFCLGVYFQVLKNRQSNKIKSESSDD